MSDVGSAVSYIGGPLSDDTPPPSVYEWELKVIERDGTPVESFHSAETDAQRAPLEAFSGQETLNDTAAPATAVLPIDADANDWLVEHRLVLLYVRGVFVTGWTVGAADDDLIAQGEGAAERVSHHLAHLNAILIEALVYPAIGMDAKPPGEDRIFDSSDPARDNSDFDPAEGIGTLASVQPQDPPDPTTQWPLPFASDYGDLPPGDADAITILGPAGVDSSADQGFYYWYKDIDFDAGFYRFQAWWDDAGELRIDGDTIVENSPGFATAHLADMVQLSEGVHRVWAKIANGPGTGVFTNPVGFALRIASLDGGGTETGLYEYTGLGTDYWWNDVANTPGWTPGAIGAQEYLEARGRACWETSDDPGVPHLTLDFDGEVDCEGSGWVNTWDVATKAGETAVGEHQKEMSETYLDFAVQWDEDDGLVWRLWDKGERGATVDVEFERAGNIGELRIIREPTKMSTAVVKWHEGFHEVTASPVAGHPRVEAPLSLGAQRSVAEVERVAGPQLDQFGRIREKVALKIVTGPTTPDDVMPGLAFWVGDTVTIPGDRTFAPITARIIAMTVELAASGEMTFTPEFGDLILDPRARPAQTMRRLGPGGTGPTASPPSTR